MKLTAIGLFVLAIISAISPVVSAAFYDDFEDGVLMDNWTWNWGGSIVADSIRPNNQVLRSDVGGQGINSIFGNTVPWSGFDCQTELLVRVGYKHGGYFHIRPENEPYVINTHFQYEGGGDNPGDNPNLGVEVAWNFDGEIGRPSFNAQIYETQWVKFHLWHSTETNLINFELTKLTGELLGALTISPVENFSNQPDINHIGIYTGSENYFDNVSLTPEPSTIIVLTLGSFFLLKRNRQ